MKERLGLLDIAAFGARNYLDPHATEAAFSSGFVRGSLWHQVHGGLLDVSGDPSHSRQNRRLLETLWPKLDLVVDVNFRMSETSRWADVVLPAAYWYEKVDLEYLVSFAPYVHLGDRAVPPLGEARPEWWIFARLSEAVARQARARGLEPYTDIAGERRDAGRLDEAFTDRGRWGPEDEEKALEFILQYRLTAVGGHQFLAGRLDLAEVLEGFRLQPGLRDRLHRVVIRPAHSRVVNSGDRPRGESRRGAHDDVAARLLGRGTADRLVSGYGSDHAAACSFSSLAQARSASGHSS